MRVLVCGGRNYANRTRLTAVLEDIHYDYGIDSIIEGGATGADKLASQWANERGISVITVPADWVSYRKAAGPIRNKKMLTFKPDLVVAFPGGKGTASMVSIARIAGVPVTEIKD